MIWLPDAPDPTTRTAPGRELRGVAVATRVNLEQPGGHGSRELRDRGPLIWTGGDNYVGRFDRGVVAVDEEALPSWLLSETRHPRSTPHRGPDDRRVAFHEPCHLVAFSKAVGVIALSH